MSIFRRRRHTATADAPVRPIADLADLEARRRTAQLAAQARLNETLGLNRKEKP